MPDQNTPCLRIGMCFWKYDSWKGPIHDPDVSYSQDDYLAIERLPERQAQTP